MGTQIFEQQIQLRQGVGDGRSRKERRAEIAPRALLNSADGVQQVRGFLTAVGISQSRHTAVAGVEHQILEVVRFIDEQMVYSHLLKIHRIVLLRVDCLL